MYDTSRIIGPYTHKLKLNIISYKLYDIIYMNSILRPLLNKTNDLQKMTFPFWGHYFGEGIFGSLTPFASACLAFKGKFIIFECRKWVIKYNSYKLCESLKVINESSTFGYLADRYNLSNMVSFFRSCLIKGSAL